MYECPNCGGNLKFDIGRQQLCCGYCDTAVDPYSLCEKKGADNPAPPEQKRTGEYEATVFTCSQCGGQLVSEDATAATFCSFCGSSVILDSRISKRRRPEYIIPFIKTKEDCRKAYGKMLRRAVFAPKELKNEELVEKFRGIYMPYWVYSFEKKEKITFPGEKTRRRGDYLITEHYQLDSEIWAQYSGMAYDASSSFSDYLSNAIAPFDLRQGKHFVPAFLSGFYADTNDVERYVYQQEAEELVIRDSCDSLLKNAVCRRYHAGQGNSRRGFRNALRPSERKAELAMLPVWFLSYRSGDRIGYAVVNGQTGKAAADLPVDRKKYLAGSMLLAIPLFFLLNLFLTITPGKILLIAALLAVVCILIANFQISRILARKYGEDDMGLESVRDGSRIGNVLGRRSVWSRWSGSVLGKIIMLLILFYGLSMVPAFLMQVMDKMPVESGGTLKGMIIFGIMVGLVKAAAYLVRGTDGEDSRERAVRRYFYRGHFREKWPILIKPFVGILFAAAILILHPVSDWFYYLGAFACMGMVLWTIMDMISCHNELTTRKPPQFNRRGGDENE